MKKFIVTAMAVLTGSVVSSNRIFVPAKLNDLKISEEVTMHFNVNTTKKDISTAD